MEIIKEKQYQWNGNFRSHIAHTDIKAVVEELEAILELRGKITPEYVIESSKNRKSVLHDYFEWDNETAAHKWRMRQASTLLARIEVRVIKDGTSKTIRAYEVINRNNQNQKQSAFINIDNVSEEQKAAIVKYVICDIEKIKTRLQSIDNSKKAIDHLNMAISELSKKSTETKEEIKLVLSAVV